MNLRPATFITSLVILCLLALQVTLMLADTDRTVGVRLLDGPGGVEVDAFLRQSPAREAGLKPGDAVIAVDGRPVDSVATYNRLAAGLQRAQPARFRVLRDGAELELSVLPGIAMEWHTVVLNLLAVLGHLGVALVAGAERSRDVRARLLAILSFAIAAELSLPVSFLTFPALFAVTGGLFYALIGLQFASELHLLSVLPARRVCLERHPWLPRLYYGAGALFALCGTLGQVGGEDGLGLLPFGSTAFDHFHNAWVLPLWALGVAAWFLATALTWKGNVGRQQAALMFLANLPWASLTLYEARLTHRGQSSPGWLHDAVTFALLCYAAGILYAIFRAHLLGFAVVVRRSLVYSGLSAALLAALYLIVGVLGAIFQENGKGGRSLWLFALASLMLGLAFNPLKSYLKRVIDRRFFPREEELPRSVAEIERLVEIATEDGLTGLARREVILRQLGAEVQRAERHKRALSVVLFDLDSFKAINDQYGHLVGDALLTAVAGALRRTARATDLIGRYGGEEFLAVLPETDLAGAFAAAEKLREAVARVELPRATGQPVRATISAGIASLRETPGLSRRTAEALIAAADEALYRAKANGRNRTEAILSS